MENTITPSELITAKSIARRAASKWSLVEAEDLEQSLILWLYENRTTVQRYREDPEGPAKLFVALRRKANSLCVKDQAERSGTPLDFNAKYSLAQIERTIEAIFNLPSTRQAVRVHPATGEMLDEYQPFIDEAQAMMLDVHVAFTSLDDEAQAILAMKYLKGFTYRDIALLLGISAPGARKRIRKHLRKIQSLVNR
jgi:RNA polymerase sigma factor (sigma-70 family)